MQVAVVFVDPGEDRPPASTRMAHLCRCSSTRLILHRTDSVTELSHTPILPAEVCIRGRKGRRVGAPRFRFGLADLAVITRPESSSGTPDTRLEMSHTAPRAPLQHISPLGDS